jgi:hypothetical protein
MDNTQSTDTKNTLLTTPITNENVALNIIVSFLNIAQRRGSFSLDESAKIWECITVFQKLTSPSSSHSHSPSPSSSSS